MAATRELGLPVVFKADGLAAGKGVLIVRDQDDLDAAIDAFFVQRRFGDAAERVLVEECLEGDEVSYMVISDGSRVVPIATSHDYKRAGENDEGPNTGGMGAHSPALVIPPGTSRLILDTVVRPTISGMAAEGREYRGVSLCRFDDDGRGAQGAGVQLSFRRSGDPGDFPASRRRFCRRGAIGR